MPFGLVVVSNDASGCVWDCAGATSKLRRAWPAAGSGRDRCEEEGRGDRKSLK